MLIFQIYLCYKNFMYNISAAYTDVIANLIVLLVISTSYTICNCYKYEI